MTWPIRAPVCVTGATGYLAGHVVRELLERGATVRATARDPANERKVGHLLRLADASPGTLELFAENLTDERAELFINSLDTDLRITTNRPRTWGVRVSYDF